MGFLSDLFGGSEESRLERAYIQMFQQSWQEASKQVREMLAQCKQEAAREGTDNLPRQYGDRLLEAASKSRASHTRPSRWAGTRLSADASMPLTLHQPFPPANARSSATSYRWQGRPGCHRATSGVPGTCGFYPRLASPVHNGFLRVPNLRVRKPHSEGEETICI
jgi:hypothetical protein